LSEIADVYSQIRRFLDFVSAWNPGPTRWIKMSMRIFRLPGGEGGVREPYRMPVEAELQKFTKGLLALGLPEIDEMAHAAGLK
jgi:hypothetical protein